MPVKSNEHHNPLKWNSWNKQWKNMLLNYIFERIEMLSTNCLHAVAPQTNNETYTYNTYVHKAPLRHLNEWIFRCRDYIRRLPCTANFLAAVHTRDVTRGARLWCASATVHNLLWFCCDIYIYMRFALNWNRKRILLRHPEQLLRCPAATAAYRRITAKKH